ncbi:UDP-glucose 4-epimerase GalE [Acuticoccus kandeliae]|uniref:UDP-glucose 4-epimerase GalE n=1 Tax=Acuticoccus kandeliae TaxID=2073160 RepID=UPI000D3E5DB3|nr:UDP-glucose 4-epimerase GalE [Acuticoccus kandeliae]
MGKILITGGAGYIGSHVAKAVARAGLKPVVFDDLSTGSHHAVRWGAFEPGDILDTRRLHAVFAAHRPVGIIHLAALSIVAESHDHPEPYHAVNVEGTRRLLSVARTYGPIPVVFSSSCAVYGAAPRGPIAEDAPLAPISPYGATKLAAEREVLRTNVPAMILRYFNAAGADPDGEIGEDRPVETHLLPVAFQATGGGAPLPILGTDYPTADGTAVRDYVHVSDIADIHVKSLRHLLLGRRGRTLNVGSGVGHSVREIVRMVEAITGATVPTTLCARRPGDPPSLHADVRAARALFGDNLTPHSDLATIVATAWRWHRQRATRVLAAAE